MKMRSILACAVMALGGVTVGQSPAQADIPLPTPVPGTPGAWIHGVGHFTYDEPGVEGHRIRFSIHARVATNGTAHGVFGYRHVLPDGQEIGAGFAKVTCVHVHHGTALVAAVVPEGKGNVANHGFYIKIIEGGRWGPDRIETLQAAGGDEPPPRYCVDPAEFPGINRYPVDPGGYAFGS